jgi:hypothetical protein
MAATESITIRCDEGFKRRAMKFCETQGRSLSDLLITSAERQMVASCEHCGRSDPPSGAAGLSNVAEDFFTNTRHGMPALVTITVIGQDRPIAYHARLIPKVNMFGMVHLYVKHLQGGQERDIPFVVPRGLITGWDDDDTNGSYYRSLVDLGYRPGNDQVIRGSFRGKPQATVTLRLVSDTIYEQPGLTLSEYVSKISLYSNPRLLDGYILTLIELGIIEERTGNRLQPRLQDADDALEALRHARRTIDI